MRRGYLTLFRVSVAGLLLLSFLQPIAAQTPSESEGKPLFYRVKMGDTLNLIMERYLVNRDVTAEFLQANAGINQHELQVGQMLIIPRNLVRYAASRAVVAYSKCASPISLAGSNAEIKVGSAIKQGDVIVVPAQCDLSLQFEDRSIVRMPSGGSIKVKVLRKSALEKSPEVQLNLLDGRVEVKVPRRQSDDAPFGVDTPNSVAGVRGTEFRVSFDTKSGVGKVEVSSGLVATKGVADIAEAGVSAQKGVVIPKIGLADQVEDLPKPVVFSSAQAQQTPGWELFIFQGSPSAKRFSLREESSINSPGGTEAMLLKDPIYLSTKAGSAAKILTWSGQTASGLVGDETTFAVCSDPRGVKPGRCNVLFDLAGLKDPLLTLVEVNPPNPSIDILRAYRPTKGSSELMVKGLPVGKYQWEITSVVREGLRTKQEGSFELIAATKN